MVISFSQNIKKQIQLPFLLMAFLFSFGSMHGQQVKAVNDTARSNIFPYRAWSIAVDDILPDVEELYFKEAVNHAGKYKINTLELHDFVMYGGIVDALVNYDSFPKLKNKEGVTYMGKYISWKDKMQNLSRFNKMIAPAKQNNIKVNAWYHVMRDLPAEIVKEYPEIKNIESGLLWKYIKTSLSEFFEKAPEVDRLTLISLHETPSILKLTGKQSKEEVLLKLYMVIYETCRKYNKELIIRDFIVSQEDYETFWNVLNKLPQDIYIMTKSISADWSHLDLGINPVMHKYINRKLIVEFDLYGEWSGRGDFPVCYPDDIIRHLRESKALNAVGAVGRLIHDDRPLDQLPFKTIFDGPQEINVYAFSKFMSEPINWLGETHKRWNEDIEAVNKKYWMIWAREKYGEAASVAVVRALERTAQINKLTFDIAGLNFRLYIWYPTLFKTSAADTLSNGHSWNTFLSQVKLVGIDYLRDEKKQAMDLAKQSLKDIQSARGKLSKAEQVKLEKLFNSMLLIIESYQLALEGYNQLYVTLNKLNQQGKINASSALKLFADKIDKQKGKGWYFNLSTEMRVLAGNILDGRLP